MCNCKTTFRRAFLGTGPRYGGVVVMPEKLFLVVGVFMLLVIVLRATAWLFSRVGGSIDPPPVRDARRSCLAGDDQGDSRRAADVGGPRRSPVVGRCFRGQSPIT